MKGLARVERTLHSLWVRVLLSALILASLVPHPDDHLTDLVFLAVFGIELALRVAVFVGLKPSDQEVGTVRRRALTGASLVIDFIALLTFLPWAGMTGLVEVRWLRLLRLLRMLLLIGYWAPILRDTWQVLSRHDRMRQVSLLGLVVMLIAFAGATILTNVSVPGTDFDGDLQLDADDAHFWSRLWWAFRQVQDPGNLVTDPGEITVVLMSLVLTVAGIFVVSFLIGLATDVVRELVALARNRPVGWKGHTVVVHATPGLPRLLSEMTRYYEKLFRRPQLVVADEAAEPPAALRTGDLARVRWRQIDERGEGLTSHTDLASARRVVVLAKPDAPYPDAHTAATVLDVREANARAWVVVEVLDPNNVAAAKVAGGARTVVVSSERLLGVWALAAIRRPEQIAVAFDLLVTRGGAEIYTCFLDADGLEGPGTPWRPTGGRFAQLRATAHEMAHDKLDKRKRSGGVVPLGLIYANANAARPADASARSSHEDAMLVLGPQLIEPRPVRALVAIGDHFTAVQRLALRVHGGAIAPAPPQEPAGLMLEAPSAPPRPRRVLVCGFRPATAQVCAGMLTEARDGDVAITLVMRHEESLRQAAEMFRELEVGDRRLFTGRFEAVVAPSAAVPPDTSGERYRWVADDGAIGGMVTLVQADWTSERMLVGLEAGVDHVSAYDLVLLLGSHLPEYDGRSAIACLKIADLARLHPERFLIGHRIIAGIADAELGRRLEERFARATLSGTPKLKVLPTEDLRSLFLFQSIAVPGWESIFLELLGPGGKGFVRLPAIPRAGPGSGAGDDRVWSFEALARALEDRGVLIALELADRRVYAPGPHEGPWSEREIRAVWLLADET